MITAEKTLPTTVRSSAWPVKSSEGTCGEQPAQRKSANSAGASCHSRVTT